MSLSEIVGISFLIIRSGCTSNATKYNYEIFKLNFPDSTSIPKNALEEGVRSASAYHVKDTSYIKDPDNKLFPACV